MRTDEFDYPLPDSSIARYPLPEREDAKLLVLERHQLQHRRVRDFAELVPEGALLVVNRTKVMPVRLLGHRLPTLGKVELFLLREEGQGVWQALGKATGRLTVGQLIAVGDAELEIVGHGPEGLLEVRARGAESMLQIMQRFGHVPIPPYLGRPDEAVDRERYQTVFAEEPGSVAAPTAGLHLTARCFDRLEARGVRVGKLTLHVGLGTFRPVTTEKIHDHQMHAESIEVPPELAEEVKAARERNAKVVAVGTTVVRALESAATRESGLVQSGSFQTSLFIAPGYQFKVVDALFTNFHLPKSTLLMLVSAFAGKGRVMGAYQQALAAGYRFLSYGDAMWIPARWESGSC